MSNSSFDNSYIKYELYGVYKYTKIYAFELEIPRCCIRFLYNYLIVRKIGISCEVVKRLFFLLFTILLCSSHQMHHSPLISMNIF